MCFYKKTSLSPGSEQKNQYRMFAPHDFTEVNKIAA